MVVVHAGAVASTAHPSLIHLHCCFLQYIQVIQGDKDFYGLWEAVLKALQVSTALVCLFVCLQFICSLLLQYWLLVAWVATHTSRCVASSACRARHG